MLLWRSRGKVVALTTGLKISNKKLKKRDSNFLTLCLSASVALC